MMSDMELAEFTYFKASGKFYTSGETYSDMPFHIFIRKVRQGRVELPGLQSGTWTDGPILVVYRGVPHIVAALIRP